MEAEPHGYRVLGQVVGLYGCLRSDDQVEKDKGTILVLLDRFNRQRLPRAMDMKKRVNAGEVLSKFDHELIKEMQESMLHVNTIIARNPEYKELTAKIMELWTEIIEKDLENIKKQDSQS